MSEAQNERKELNSTDLLCAGFFVVETRSRRRDKTLTPWRPKAAFIDDGEASEYNRRCRTIGYSRKLSPNGKV